MDCSFQPMTQQQAEEIAAHWRYSGEYSFYDMDADPEDLAEFLNPEERKNTYFSVIQNKEVVGFYSFTQAADATIDVGLGMKPDLTGNGNGTEFLRAGMKFARTTYNPEKITLSVAAFNKRAIKVYEKMDFKEVERFQQATNGSVFEFVKMVYYCSNTI
ncbi:GNAT family N-acetyltransferase [Planococcus halotolerans]|uniref:GNAT family N-acetyltransferase n=1 Tax=Planococcus halotolerans TaxID=2233542 RepID=UPI0010922F68|nr:GNAT family protein [Planococcus halotolerans]QHJ69899.1 GNAT family N-acetyltransferase [Planococcus halotolerans]